MGGGLGAGPVRGWSVWQGLGLRCVGAACCPFEQTEGCWTQDPNRQAIRQVSSGGGYDDDNDNGTHGTGNATAEHGEHEHGEHDKTEIIDLDDERHDRERDYARLSSWDGWRGGVKGWRGRAES